MLGVILVLLVGSIGVLALTVLSFRRLVEELPSIRKLWREIYADKGDAIATWTRWGCFGQFLYVMLLALLLIVGLLGDQFAALVAFIVLLLLAIPFAFIVEGLKILNLGYAEIRPMFVRPLYFITGSGAIHRGKAKVVIGLLLLISWLWFVCRILEWLH